MGRKAITGLILWLLGQGLAAQTTGNHRCLEVLPGRYFTDTLVIVPATLQIADSSLTGSRIVPGDRPNTYKVVAPVANRTVKVCYRVLPASLTSSYRVPGVGVYDTLVRVAARHPGSPGREEGVVSRREGLFDLGELSQGGSISRGISMGSNQNLFVNSALNLNLEGRLADNLFIRASITDQTLPYQPEGNTQQLQDFDNVFIELYNDRFSLAGGDIVLRNQPDTYFLRYLKNVQGGQLAVKTATSTTTLGLSAAKGQFASVWVPVEEGIAGPYKIPPPDQRQQFVIIIANSEKVYLDDRLLTRGFNYDYTIDYNQGEITFTSNVVITAYSRIRVDYEYAVRDFARSIISLQHRQQLGRASVTLNYYREGDNPDRPLFTTLSEQQRAILARVGNDTDRAVAPSARLTPYNPDQILYYRKDTTTSTGRPVRIFVRATQPRDSVYSVKFSEVGPGQGSYEIKEYLAAGRVYEWVGEGRGRFVAWELLPAATRKEMLVLGLQYQTGTYSRIFAEGAFSHADRNLFSTLDDEQNRGYAFKTGYRLADRPLRGTGGYKLELSLAAEYLDRNFIPVDRFRRVEFDRDWSYTPVDSLPVTDLLLSGTVGVRKNAANGLRYRLSQRGREEQLQGWQHYLEGSKSLGKLQVNATGMLMNSRSYGRHSQWRKLHTELFMRWPLQPGYRYIVEQHMVRNDADSILYSANYFTAHQVFLRSNPAATTRFEVSYANRLDQTPQAGDMQLAARSDNARASLVSTIGKNHRISLVANYRLYDKLLAGSEEVESITGRLDWNGNLVSRVLRSELNYSVANARVPRREYVFVEVPTGQGTHTWRDDNGDGVKDLDEFYEALFFDEKNYIKVYVNTSEFVNAYENIFNYRLTYRPPRAWRKQKGLLNLLGRISNTTAWTSSYRTTENTPAARLLPFLAEIDEQQVLSMRETLRTTFFINKSDPRFGIVAGYAVFRKKYLYANGFESRSDREYNLTLRWNLNRYYNLKINALTASRQNNSDYLAGRNYRISEIKTGPLLAWQPRPALRVSGSYVITLKNSLDQAEKPVSSAFNEVLGELKLGMAGRYQVQAVLRYTRIRYAGDEMSPLGYEMLQGLRPGDNLLWTLGWQQQLLNGLQITLHYEGRKPDGRPVIHSGRAGVRALF